MIPGDLLGSILAGTLSGRGKRSRRTLSALSHGHLPSLSTRTILGAAAVAWGLYEALQGQKQREGGSGGPEQPTTPAPPPIPTPAVSPPVEAAPAAERVPTDVARLVRLMISAARADGELSPEEGQRIARRAADAGAEALVRSELQDPKPLAEIVRGVTDPAQKTELYALAFAIVRADESVSGAERIYLAQLAHQLGLDAASVARLEEETAARIDQEA